MQHRYKRLCVSKTRSICGKSFKKNNLKILKGIANLGYRPTFNQKKILLEVHLFNFSGNLYNKHLSVEFLKFIRKEKNLKILIS
jgi:riboflavin kinase/FMN adenylyltransferase